MGYCLPKALAPSVVGGAGGGGGNPDKNIEISVGERYYRKSSIKPPGGLIFFPSTFEGGLKREGGGGLFNLAKRTTCSKNTVV